MTKPTKYSDYNSRIAFDLKSADDEVFQHAQVAADLPSSKDWQSYEGFLFPWTRPSSLAKYLKKIGAPETVAQSAIAKKKEPSQPIVIKPTVDLAKMPNMKGDEDGVLSKAICLRMDFGLFGNTRQVSTDRIDVKNADGTIDEKIKKRRLTAQKRLLESPELDAIRTFDYYTRKHVRAVSLPYDVGMDLVPFPAVPSIDEWLEKRAKERAEVLVPAFLAVYPAQCEAASNDLGSQHNPTDYKTIEQARAEFVFKYNWIRFGVPGQLQSINKDVWQKENAKAQASMNEATREMQAVMRAAMLKLVQHMSERLKEDESGKPLTFKSSTVGNLVEFLGNFDFRNITNDEELQKVVKQAKSLLTGVNPDELKDIGAVREKVKAGIEGMAKKLDKLVIQVGRKFQTDDED